MITPKHGVKYHKRMNAKKTPQTRYRPTPRRVGGGTRPGGGKRPAGGTGRSGAGGAASKVAAGVAAAIAVVAAIAFAVPAIGSLLENGKAADTASATKVTFVAVGDNLPDEYIGWAADRLAGDEDDGAYDYSSMYAPIVSYTRGADLAYVDEETHLGGDDIGPKGYPSFNTTDAMATAIVDAGFDFVASATNHSYDWGNYGALDHSLSVWEKQPVAFTGTAVTKEQYERIAVQERNGITFALLNYTYGVNGFSPDALPPYAVNFIDEERIASDVARAREQADVVLVAMHWGTELLTEADDEQLRLAQFLADLDVDVVLGSHPHVIGPMRWVTNSSNPDHRTLVAFSLGNFLADHDAPMPDNVLEGMLTCDFVREKANGPVMVENVRWVPLVFHSNEDRTEFAVYPVDDYPASLAKQNRALTGIADPITWLYETTRAIVGPEWF